MFRLVQGESADEIWCKVADLFRVGDGDRRDSRGGPTTELLHVAISISDPRQRWVISRNPPINPAFSIAEVVWIMRGRNDSAFLNFFNTNLPKCAGEGQTYYGAYGHRLRKHFGVDQLERAYNSLRNSPETRQVVLQMWDCKSDLPLQCGRPRDKDIPCNLLSMLKISNGKLEWCQVMRSNDVFRGLPYNLAQFTSLQEIMAGWLGLEVGSYNHISDSLHEYDCDAKDVEASTRIDSPRNGDSLCLEKGLSDGVFQVLDNAVDQMISPGFPAHDLHDVISQARVPEPYRNLLSVLCAECARRKRDPQVAREMIEMCTNPVLRDLFNRWIHRFHSEGRDA